MKLNIKIGDKFWSVQNLNEYEVVKETRTTFYLATFGGVTPLDRIDKSTPGEDFDRRYVLSYAGALYHHIEIEQRRVDGLRAHLKSVQEEEK